MHAKQLNSHFLTESTSISRMHTSISFASETLLTTGLSRLELSEAKILEHNSVNDRMQAWAGTPPSLV